MRGRYQYVIATISVIIVTIVIVVLANIINVKYSITFNVNDSEYHILATKGLEEIKLPEDPMKQGFTFDGWFFDKDSWKNELTEDYYSSKKINSDIVVYAKFIQSSKIITFYVGDEVCSTFNFLEDENFTLPQNPTMKGYIFDGWYYDNNVWLDKADISNIPLRTEYVNLNVYAKFIEKEKPTINFYVNGELFFTDTLNEDFVMPSNPTIEYYTFDGWFFDENIWEESVTLDKIKDKTEKQINVFAKFSTEYVSNLNYILSDDGTYYIVKGRGECTSSKILIPNFYNDLPVKEIGNHAFLKDSVLEEIIIGSNVEKLNVQPFGLCSSLKRVDFLKNSKLTTLGSYPFNGCSLEYIFIPKGITQLPKGCFSGSLDETEIIFEAPENIMTFGDYAFQNLNNTTLPIFPNLETIGEHAFTGSTLKSFYLPKTLKYIGNGAFNECRKVTYIEMEDIGSWLNVEIVGGRFSMPWCYTTGFYMNNEKVLDLVIPEGVKEIKDYAFLYCSAIESITIPESVEKIGTAAFADVLKLKTLNYNAKNCTLSIEISSVDLNYPFENAGKYTLTNMGPHWTPPEGYKDVIVNIGENVESIPSKLFYSPSAHYPTFIGTINFKSVNPPTFGEDWLTKTSTLKAINVPNNSMDAYVLALGENLNSYINGVA